MNKRRVGASARAIDAARAHIRRFTSIWGDLGVFYVILGVFRGISAYFALCGGGRRHNQRTNDCYFRATSHRDQ